MADSDCFVPATSSRLRVMRQWHAVIRDWKIPKPVVLVDTRERDAFHLYERHPNWIGDEKRATLKAGDYSLEGMQSVLALERKSLIDVIQSTMASRERFIRSCARLEKYRWKAILIEATYEDMKTPYSSFEDIFTEAHPNAVLGTMDAIEAKFGIPVIFTSRHRALSSEKAASWLSKHFMYWWLEKNGHERVLVDNDNL